MKRGRKCLGNNFMKVLIKPHANRNVVVVVQDNITIKILLSKNLLMKKKFLKKEKKIEMRLMKISQHHLNRVELVGIVVVWSLNKKMTSSSCVNGRTKRTQTTTIFQM